MEKQRKTVYACTICSKEKSEDPKFLPACERYTSPRVKQVIAIAKQEKLPLLFLSGKYGLISADTKIPYYDQRLEADQVEALVSMVTKQCEELQVVALHFYARPKETEGWGAYYDVLEKVCKNLGIPFSVVLLTEL